MEDLDLEEIRKALNERDIAILSKELLIVLQQLEKPLSKGVELKKMYEKMS